MRAVYNTPHEAFCITLFLTNCVVNCQIPTRQNQSVQLRLICIYVCPTSAHWGFRCGYRPCKYNIFCIEKNIVWLKKRDFMDRFNIIKHKYVKEIHFCVIFLTKKFVLSMIIRIFAATESATLPI